MYKAVLILYATALKQMVKDPEEFCPSYVQGTCTDYIFTIEAEKKIEKYVSRLLDKCNERIDLLDQYTQYAPNLVDQITNEIFYDGNTGKPVPVSKFHQFSDEIRTLRNYSELNLLSQLVNIFDKGQKINYINRLNNTSKQTINKYFPLYKQNDRGLLDSRNRHESMVGTKNKKLATSGNLRDDSDEKKYGLMWFNRRCTQLYELEECVENFKQSKKNVDRVYNRYKKSALRAGYPEVEGSIVTGDPKDIIKELNEINEK